jgi:hypothetical protein
VADIADPLPLPVGVADAVRLLLRGEQSAWPGGATDALEQHGTAPLVYARLTAAGGRDEALRPIAIRAAVAEPQRLDDLRSLLQAFAEREIPVLILKGTALAYDLYDAPELRPRGDTDLLVREQDVGAVRTMMRELGYVTQLTSGDTLAVRQQSFTRGGHVYDVHWDVVNSAVVRDALPWTELVARAIALPRIGAHAFAPSHGDALMLACLHRVVHHHDIERLIWLYDIHLLREAMSREEHARFWRLAAERRVVAICERSIELADSSFAAQRHDRASDFLRESDFAGEPSAAMLSADIRRGALLAGEMKALRWRDRIRRARELAFPPIAFIRQSFRASPRVALPALYVWRGVRGVVRLFRGVRT